MASDIHKKLVLGALGCGVFFIIAAGIGVFLSKGDLFKDEAQRAYTPDEGVSAWTTLSHLSIADSLAAPSLPPLPVFGTTAKGTLFLRPLRGGENLPAFGDTFPGPSKERKSWEESGNRVSVTHGGGHEVASSAGYRLFQARSIFAAAETWSHDGDTPDARLALDSALSMAAQMQHSGALERVLVGARIERDAMVVLSRDSALGGPEASVRAAQRVAPLDRYIARLRRVDQLLMEAGSNPTNARELGQWVADSSKPLALRTAAVRAVGLGWVFSATEPGLGVDTVRTAVLQHLRTTSTSDSVIVVVDRVIHEGDTFSSRIRVASAYRAERMFLDWR